MPKHCSTIFVKGLPYSSNENEIADIFKGCGEVKEVRMVTNWKSREFKGFAYIEFVESLGVVKALKMNGMVYQERRLKIVSV